MLFNGDLGVIHGISAGKLRIHFDSKDACEECGLKVICAPGDKSQRELTLPDPGGLESGQSVHVVETANLELHLALAQFGLPLLLFLFGLFIGYSFPLIHNWARELNAFMDAVLGLVISYPLAKGIIQRITDRIPSHYLMIKPV